MKEIPECCCCCSQNGQTQLYLAVQVPTGLHHLLEELAREVMRQRPKNIEEFLAHHLEERIRQGVQCGIDTDGEHFVFLSETNLEPDVADDTPVDQQTNGFPGQISVDTIQPADGSLSITLKIELQDSLEPLGHGSPSDAVSSNPYKAKLETGASEQKIMSSNGDSAPNLSPNPLQIIRFQDPRQLPLPSCPEVAQEELTYAPIFQLKSLASGPAIRASTNLPYDPMRVSPSQPIISHMANAVTSGQIQAINCAEFLGHTAKTFVATILSLVNTIVPRNVFLYRPNNDGMHGAAGSSDHQQQQQSCTVSVSQDEADDACEPSKKKMIQLAVAIEAVTCDMTNFQSAGTDPIASLERRNTETTTDYPRSHCVATETQNLVFLFAEVETQVLTSTEEKDEAVTERDTTPSSESTCSSGTLSPDTDDCQSNENPETVTRELSNSIMPPESFSPDSESPESPCTPTNDRQDHLNELAGGHLLTDVPFFTCSNSPSQLSVEIGCDGHSLSNHVNHIDCDEGISFYGWPTERGHYDEEMEDMDGKADHHDDSRIVGVAETNDDADKEPKIITRTLSRTIMSDESLVSLIFADPSDHQIGQSGPASQTGDSGSLNWPRAPSK